MNDKKTPEFYLDWFCRVHEDAAAKSNLMLTDDAREAIRHIWKEHAEKAAKRPAIYRLRSADFFHFCSEAADLMVRSARYTGKSSIAAAQVKAGTLAMEELAPTMIACAVPIWPGCVEPIAEGTVKQRAMELDASIQGQIT